MDISSTCFLVLGPWPFKATLRLNPCRLCMCDYFSHSHLSILIILNSMDEVAVRKMMADAISRQGLQPRCPVSARIATKMKRSGLWNGLNEFFCDGAFWCPVCLNAWLRTPLPKGYLHCLIGLLFQIPHLKDFIQFQRTCFPVILICSNHCRVPAR